MLKLDRYLLSEFLQSFLATLIVLLVVSVGGVLVDLLGNIADGRLPAALLLSQLGLQFVVHLPLILSLSLMLGLLLALSRLYRDSEMAVLTAIGVGPRRLLRPILLLVLPLVALIGLCSLWLGPWANATAAQMIEDANRSVVMAGLEPGQFTSLGDNGVVYLTTISPDGKQLGKVFMQRTRQGRLDVVTAARGEVYLEGRSQRFLRLHDGFRVEGPADGAGLDYRLMRFAGSEAQLPAHSAEYDADAPELLSSRRLLSDQRPQARSELHLRLASPLLALAFALLALPLSRSAPRQQRYGRMMLAFLAYVVGSNVSALGARWIADGRIPAALGLWWLTLPLLALAIWMYARDGRLARPRGRA